MVEIATTNRVVARCDGVTHQIETFDKEKFATLVMYWCKRLASEVEPRNEKAIWDRIDAFFEVKYETTLPSR